MRVKLLAAAGMGIVLAGCSHGSDGSSAVQPSAAPASKVAASPAASTVAGYDLKGRGFVTGADGKLKPVTVGAKVSAASEAEAAMIKGNTPLVKLVYSGDKPFTGTNMSTRRDSGEKYGAVGDDTRFLMSDASINSKDAPTAFGVFRDASSKDKFNAAAYYGGATATNMPTSGQASYNGKFAGGVNEGNGASGEQSHVSGKFNLAADFGKGTVKGTVNELTATSRDAATKVDMGGITGLTFDGTMAKGAATYSADKIAIVGGSVGPITGNVEGGFYNANASETAGIITATSGGANSAALVGAFHGEKQP